MSSFCYEPLWTIKVTHVPSGEVVMLNSEYHKSMREAHALAIQIIKSRLYMRKQNESI